MLFILVMDVFNTLIQRASDEGLLHPLSNRPLRHRVSLYADDWFFSLDRLSQIWSWSKISCTYLGLLLVLRWIFKKAVLFQFNVWKRILRWCNIFCLVNWLNFRANILVFLYPSENWPKTKSNQLLLKLQTNFQAGKLNSWHRLANCYGEGRAYLYGGLFSHGYGPPSMGLESDW